MQAVHVVAAQALQHQVALEAADLGLAEIVPELAARPVIDGPVRVPIENVPNPGGAVRAIDEPSVHLDAALVALLDHVPERVIARRDAVGHWAQVAAEKRLAAPVPHENKGRVEVGLLDLRDGGIRIGEGFDLGAMQPDAVQLRMPSTRPGATTK
jgi:hypothetical protein